MVVGIDSGSVFDRITNDFAVPLERDDCLLLYTDGVTEALDANGDEFGLDRMIQCVRASAPSGAPAMITQFDRRAAKLRWSAAAKRRHHFNRYSQNMRRIPVTESTAEGGKATPI